jgi:hypothetical protein
MRFPGAALALQTCTEAAVAGARAARRAGPADLVTRDDPVLGHHGAAARRGGGGVVVFYEMDGQRIVPARRSQARHTRERPRPA